MRDFLRVELLMRVKKYGKSELLVFQQAVKADDGKHERDAKEDHFKYTEL